MLIIIGGFFLFKPITLLMAERLISVEPRDDPADDDEEEEEPIVTDPSRPTAPLRISTIQPTDAIIEDFSLTSPRLFQENR